MPGSKSILVQLFLGYNCENPLIRCKFLEKCVQQGDVIWCAGTNREHCLFLVRQITTNAGIASCDGDLLRAKREVIEPDSQSGLPWMAKGRLSFAIIHVPTAALGCPAEPRSTLILRLQREPVGCVLFDCTT